MYRGYLTRKRMRLATLDMLKDSSLDSFEEELELEGDSKSKQDFQRWLSVTRFDFNGA
jgi:hypothetical protein